MPFADLRGFALPNTVRPSVMAKSSLVIHSAPIRERIHSVEKDPQNLHAS